MKLLTISINRIIHIMLHKFRSTFTYFLLCLMPLTLQAGGSDGFDSPFFADNGFNILHKDLVKTYIRRSTSLSPNHFNSDARDEKNATKKYNLEAWSQYLKTTPDIAEGIVYNDKKSKTPSIEITPSVQRYLDIVRQQEKVVSSGLSPWLKKAKKQAAFEQRQASRDQSIEAITAQLKTETDAFLKQRYVYLLLRLQHYSHRHGEVVSFYEQYDEAIQTPNREVTHWINLLHAGSLQHLGKNAESAYLFATTFKQTKTKRLQSQINFKIKTDEEWQALLDLCKNDAEKALMHFMRAIRSNANSFQELETVYHIAPNSEWFDNLLIRELEFVQFAQETALSFQINGRRRENLNRDVLIDSVKNVSPTTDSGENAKVIQKQRRIDYLDQLSNFVTQVQQGKKRNDLFLSDYAGLYLKLLSAQAIDVSDIQRFQQQYSQDSRLPFSKSLELFVYLENLEAIDETAEKIISENLIAIAALDKDYDGKPYLHRDIMTYTYIKLEPLYLKVKQPGKYYIAKTRGNMNQDEIFVGEVKGLQTLKKTRSSNFLEQRMLEAFGEWTPQDLNKMIARKYLSAGLLAEAEQFLLKNDASNAETTEYNPFLYGLSGNNRSKTTPPGLDPDNPAFGKKTYTRAEFIGVMDALTEALKEDLNNANAHFRIGTAYYNMTWFGNSPHLVRAYRTTRSWKNGEIDFAKARQYYEKALKFTDDRELKAKTLYALAKIEGNELYINKGINFWRKRLSSDNYREAVKNNKKQGLGKYFEQLVSYEDTKYHKEVIQQCADYRYYFD